MTDHAELRRLAKAATPGPWTLYVPEDYQGPEELPGYGVECAEGRAIVWGALEPETGCQFDRDAEFIAAANPKAILALLDEIDRLKAENEALRGALQAVVDDPTWRSNDNTLWPKIIKAMDKGAKP
ncbi:ead/Ea22-like family protein [Pseudomonas aeruginosa]|uniref:ead/Ea22-like family protein n=1 Tax=Pseudomonas aeruginosa TaxID=287 RepID=UPI0024983E42|nr:ead/Ea22-like family protein [Pseudomonas aeruginosa]MDI2345926.1 ead/Ea22-like family protein [Pseudomonas aeruginosa]